MEKNYVVYHLHEDTSNVNGYADSCTKFDEYIKLAKKYNMKAIAFSNHGGAYDWIKKKQMCDKYGIKYIHGVELYLCNKLEDNNRGWHIGLYAKNLSGVEELNELLSISTSKGEENDNSDRHYYYNPRISMDELKNTSDNIIITTACLASPLWRLSNSEDEEDKKVLKDLLNFLHINKHRCFLEIQYHNCSHQIQYNKMLYDWSKKLDIPLISGTDTHSSTKYKAECRKILQKSKNSFYGEEDEFDLTWKSYDELVECFKEQNSLPMDIILDAIDNTNKFADMIEEFELDKKFKYPTLYGDTADEQWKTFIYKCLQEKINIGAIQKDRLEEYISVINEEHKALSKQGMESFMLFMGELLEWCRDNDIYVSPCRGSIGGSLIAYITGITDVDPLVWKTVFSRFCNEERISLADIDVDFSPKDRSRVYEYIINRFGNKNVSYILTLGTIKDRGSIDVLAKGLDYKDLKLVAEIKNKFDDIFANYSKVITEEVNLEELEGAESSSPDFVDHDLYLGVIKSSEAKNKINKLKYSWDELRNENKDLFYYFDGIKGTIISKGIHPAGMIGSPITLADNLGVYYKDGDESMPVSICSMKAVDSLNYVKFDILGLKTIGIIQDTYRLIGEKWRFAHEINWNDDRVWNDMIQLNSGIFQFEGNFAHELLSTFKPKSINDMSLTNAALRPSGKSYRDRLVGRKKNENPSKEIDELLKDNNGFLVFQEDTIKFLTDICGFSGSLADTTRRAIGKKDKELLQEQLPKILEGYCSHANKPREIAEKEALEFIQIVEDSSEYQFGYNHSTGYSMNGYICCMLRTYYPLEFTTSYLNWCENEVQLENGHRLLNHYNIKLNEPRFRYSRAEYYPHKETNSIYKGIESIKFLNADVADYLYSLKENTYYSFSELLFDIKGHINSRQLDILIKIGFFEEFGKTEKLIKIVDAFNTITTKKTFKYDNEYIDYILPYAAKVSEKQVKDIDYNKVMESIELSVEDRDIPIGQRIQAHMEFMGNCTLKDESVDMKVCVVTNVDTKYSPKVTLYCIATGKTSTLKISKPIFRENKLEVFDTIVIEKIVSKPKRKLVDGKWTKSASESEIWLETYLKIN